MSAVQTEILDKISAMTVLELSELIKAMEDKFGVSAAAAVAVAGPAAGAPAAGAAMAMGAISVTVILMLSPGITISVPLGSSSDPVTSVVRK